jgi:hypothetical protein
VRQLELADEINEIVNALFAQLVTQVLSAGLGGSSGVSGSGTSDLNSYVNKINNDVNITNNDLASLKAKLILQVENAITQTVPYRTNKEASLNLYISAKSKYETGRACYASKLAQAQAQQTANPIFSQGSGDHQSIIYYQSKIAEIDSIISTQITPTANILLDGVKEADSRMQILNDIKTAANNARTLNDINIPSQKFSELVQTSRLTGPQDVQESKDELSATQSKVNPLINDANRKLQECQLNQQVWY